VGDDRFRVPGVGEAARYDAVTQNRASVVPPGIGTDNEVIWAGREFRVWRIWETFDAWIWTSAEEVVR
jgi:hypothetical protein